MKRKKLLVIKVVIFSLILLTILLSISPVLQKKWIYYKDNAATEIAKGFYAEPKDSLDVIYLGTSYIRNGISPMEIWNDYGITGYVRASAQQAPVVSYYLMKEAFKTQSPKIVVYEASMIVQGETSESNNYDIREEKLHEAIDYMKFSKEKLELVNEIVRNSNIPYLGLLSPVYRYHDRWADLTEKDFEQDPGIKPYAYKGQYPALNAAPFSEYSDYMKKGEQKEDAYFDQTTIEYISKLNELCKENGAQLVLVHLPNIAWDDNKYNLVTEFAGSEEIPYLDYSSNELRLKIGYDPTTDSCDGGLHLNMDGAEKVSRHLGYYLANEFKIKDNRENPEYEQWNVDYDLYMKEKGAKQLSQQSDLFQYLEEMRASGYLIIFAAKSDVGTYFTNEIQEHMQALGLSADLSYPLYNSYIGITDGETALYEEKGWAAEGLSYKGRIDDVDVAVSSISRRGQNSSVSIRINGEEMALDNNGLNIVVYAPELGRVISKRSYNTGVNGALYKDSFSLDNLSLKSYLEEITSPRYTVFLSADKDAARCLSSKYAAKIQALGLDLNLRDLYGSPYIAVTDSGKKILEQIGYGEDYNPGETIGLQDMAISFIPGEGDGISVSGVSINGENYEFVDKGLNFVVWDKLSNQVESIRSFDTSNDSYTDTVRFDQIESITEYVATAKEKGYTAIISVGGNNYYGNNFSLLEMAAQNNLQWAWQENIPYVGIIEDWEVSYEATGFILDASYFSGNTEILISEGVEGREDMIQINGINYLREEEDIQIIVFDKAENTVVSTKAWDVM